MPDNSPTHAAAVELAARRHQGTPGPRLPDSLRPADLDAAFAVQDAVLQMLGETAGGWKCGMPAPGKLVAAPIPAGRISGTPACAVERALVRVEPEIAFILAQDLGPRAEPWTKAEIEHAIGSAHLALELIGSRYERPEEVPYVEHLADSLLNAGLVLGPEIDMRKLGAAAALRIDAGAAHAPLLFNGRHPNGNALLPLYWLAEFLRSRGRGLRAGQAVITGSWAGSFELPADQDLSLHFGELGTMAIRFTMA